MKKILLLLLLPLAVLTASAHSNDYNMVIELANGTKITLGADDVSNLTFNNGALSVSGNTIEEIYQTLEDLKTNKVDKTDFNTLQSLVASLQKDVARLSVEAVDLGLPSGRLWANMNVGASSPEDYGDYFAWGENTPKSEYNWSTYMWCNGNYDTLTKYCDDSSYGNNGFTDDKTVLDAEDDAATANWGGDWRMPTIADFQELIDNTTNEWTTQNGVYGQKFTSSNGNSIFLPAAGFRWDGVLSFAGSYGGYWSSSLYEGDPDGAWGLYFDGGLLGTGYGYRDSGRSVRPVR